MKRIAPQPHEPPPYDNSVVASIRALARGDANEGQQRDAFNWIVYTAAGYNDLSYRPDSERATCFAEGRRFVGSQILKMLQPVLTPQPKEHK